MLRSPPDIRQSSTCSSVGMMAWWSETLESFTRYFVWRGRCRRMERARSRYSSTATEVMRSGSVGTTSWEM